MEKERMGAEKIAGLIDAMIAPKAGERMLLLADYPEGKADEDTGGRRELVLRWHRAASMLASQKGFNLLPLVLYRETGKSNADLPATASTQGGGHVASLQDFIASADIAIAMTKYSATAPLKNIASGSGQAAPQNMGTAGRGLRVVSMPGVSAEMEGAMAADYPAIEARGKRLLAVVQSAVGFEVIFDGKQVPRGTKLCIDTRASNWQLDAGACRKPGDFVNFPSGELFTPPYEGATQEGRREFGDSQTSGVWPVYSPSDGKVAFLRVEKNRIERVQGNCEEAGKIIEDIATDENAANVAELGLGINGKARGTADVPVLEREKAGPHIAYGRNDHFGTPLSLAGKVRANVHVDYVYTRETPITATIYAIYQNGKRVLIAERGKIVAV